jgi:hypothetical protein
MIKMLHLADLITELNGTLPPYTLYTQSKLTFGEPGFCGVMSIFSSMRYCLGPPSAHANLWAALAFMPFGLFFDFMDGKVARWRKKSSLMGQELDSLADLVIIIFLFFLVRRNTNIPTADLIRCIPRRSRLRHRSPHSCRPPVPDLLCPLRANSSRSLQYHCGQCPKRRNWKE